MYTFYEDWAIEQFWKQIASIITVEYDHAHLAANMVTNNACLSYFDFTLPSELLLKRYEKILTEKGIIINRFELDWLRI